jgi:hypothetical protein
VRTEITLTVDEWRRLRALAMANGRSVADEIRLTVMDVAEEHAELLGNRIIPVTNRVDVQIEIAAFPSRHKPKACCLWRGALVSPARCAAFFTFVKGTDISDTRYSARKTGPHRT